MKRVIILIMIFILALTTTSYALDRQNSPDKERYQKITRIINSSNKITENRAKIRLLTSEIRSKIQQAKTRTAFLIAHKNDLTTEQLEQLKEILTILKSSHETLKNTSGSINIYNDIIKQALIDKNLDKLITVYQEITDIQNKRITELAKINRCLTPLTSYEQN